MHKSIFEKILFCELSLLNLVVLATPTCGSMVYYYFLARESIAVIIVQCIGLTLAVKAIAFPQTIKFGRPNLLLFLFIASAALSSIVALDRALAVYRLGVFFSWFLIGLACMELFYAPGRVIGFSFISGSIGAVVAVCGVLEKFMGTIIINHPPMPDRVTSLLGYPTLYAGYLLCIIFIVHAGLLVANRWEERIFLLSTMALLLLNLWLTKSLTAVITFIALEGVMISLLFLKRITRVVLAIVTIVLLVLSLFIIVNFRENSVVAKYAHERYQSIQMRLDGWSMATHMIQDRPWTGSGPDQFGIILPKYRSIYDVDMKAWVHPEFWYYPANPENFIFLFLIEQGILGLALFLSVMFITLAFAFRDLKKMPEWRRRLLICNGTGVIGYLTYSIFHMPIFSPCVWTSLWVIIGMIWGVRTSAEQHHEPVKSLVPVIRACSICVIFLSLFFIYIFIGRWLNDYHLDIAKSASMRNDLPRFEEEMESILGGVPKTWRFYMIHGNSYGNFNPEEGIRDLKQAESRNPYYGAIHVSMLQYLYADKEHYAKDIADCLIKLEKYPPILIENEIDSQEALRKYLGITDQAR